MKFIYSRIYWNIDLQSEPDRSIEAIISTLYFFARVLVASVSGYITGTVVCLRAAPSTMIVSMRDFFSIY